MGKSLPLIDVGRTTILSQAIAKLSEHFLSTTTFIYLLAIWRNPIVFYSFKFLLFHTPTLEHCAMHNNDDGLPYIENKYTANIKANSE